MDGKSVWPGFDYAWTAYPSRGVEYYAGASRVKAITTLDRVDPGNTRKTTYVKVIRLTNEGEPKMKREWRNDIMEYREVEYVDEVRARELFMRWDEYEDETVARNQQMAERELERERQRAEYERERLEQERLRRIEREEREREREERRQKVQDGLSKTDLPGTIDEYNQRITMTFDEFLEWIKSLESAPCEQCDRVLINIPNL